MVRGVESATGDWQTFTAMYTPVEDTPAIMVLNRIETGSEAVQGKLHIRNMRAEPWKMRTLPARPALRVFPSLSADGKTLYLMVLNLTLDTDIATDIAWDETAFAGAAARYSEVNGESALAGIGGVSFVAQGESLDLISAGSLRHVFPAHSATGIAIELKPQAAVAP